MYSRWGNPTADSACDVIANLEGAAGSILFASGSAAISTVLFSFLKAGDHMVGGHLSASLCTGSPCGCVLQVISQPVYGGVNAAVKTILSKLDIEVTWLEESRVEDFKEAVKSNTKVA